MNTTMRAMLSLRGPGLHRLQEGRGRSGRRGQAGPGRPGQGRRCRLEEVPAGSGDPEHGQHHQQPVPVLPPPESDPDFQAKYERQTESATQAVARGVQPGNMLAFGSSASGKMADMIQAVFKDVSPDSMKGVRVVFIGQSADNARVQAAIQPTGAEYIFVEAK
jgi:hypothetical protein